MRSPSSRVYDTKVDIDLYARIGSLEDHIKLIMEHLRIPEVKTVAPTQEAAQDSSLHQTALAQDLADTVNLAAEDIPKVYNQREVSNRT